MIERGNLRGDKIQMADDGSVWCCIWTPLPGSEDQGPCFDFHADDIDDLILLLQDLREEEAELFVPE